MSSVWEQANPGLLARLDPRLQGYFSEIPAGQVGRGSGIFECVGSPRRWLWPVFLMLSWDRVIFPVWQQQVRFEVENRPWHDERGNTTIQARRSFHFVAGTRVMVDAITAEQQTSEEIGLIDYLGSSGRLAANLQAEAKDGALSLSSTSVSFRLWRRSFTLPRAISPTVRITEGIDESTGLQQISMELRQPQLGLLYQYRGKFSYRIVPD